MYTIDDLNDRLLSELKDIAEGMGVKNAKKLAKQDLIYKILDQQAVSGEPKPTKTNEPAERKMRPPQARERIYRKSKTRRERTKQR
jgi:transcription termination factor Rho